MGTAEPIQGGVQATVVAGCFGRCGRRRRTPNHELCWSGFETFWIATCGLTNAEAGKGFIEL